MVLRRARTYAGRRSSDFAEQMRAMKPIQKKRLLAQMMIQRPVAFGGGEAVFDGERFLLFLGDGGFLQVEEGGDEEGDGNAMA